jgi:hypothetical protein
VVTSLDFGETSTFSTRLAPQLEQKAGLPVSSFPQREQNIIPPSGQENLPKYSQPP